MPNLNVVISEEAMVDAKEGAARSGMLLRKYIERLILHDGAARRSESMRHGAPREILDAERRHSNAVLEVGPQSERQLVPIDEL